MTQATQPSIQKLDHLVITTARLAQCLAFYEALGFENRAADGRYELFSGDFKINVHLLGAELSPHARHVKTGSADLCFEIDGALEDCVAALLNKGLIVELGIVARTGVRGPMRCVYLRDPDENLVELCSYST